MEGKRLKDSVDTGKINETIADLIEDHILVCDIEGRIVSSNRAIQSYLGYTDFELRQRNFSDMVADLYRNKAGSFLKNALEEPSDQEEFLFRGKHGLLKLHLQSFYKDHLVYFYGNEKYVEYERMRKKLEIEIANAIKIHKRSLPVSLPDTESISFSSLYIPAEDLGGDLFDALQVDNGLLNDSFEQYVCFIADVSGHGLDSAMLAIFVKDTIRSFFSLKHIPGQLLSPKEIVDFFVAQYRKEGYPEEYLVCLVVAVFDLKTKELTYCNAGLHICPFLVGEEGNIIELSNAGLPISTAISAKLLKYQDSSVALSPAMTLFLMSDGLPEQSSNHEFYEERLKRLVPEIHRMEPARIIQRIHEDFTGFLGHERIRDDITLMVAKLSRTLN